MVTEYHLVYQDNLRVHFRKNKEQEPIHTVQLKIFPNNTWKTG